jgi:DNA-binding XRE family transcriptional regulator
MRRRKALSALLVRDADATSTNKKEGEVARPTALKETNELNRHREQAGQNVLADVAQSAEDGLALLIQDSLDNDPGFADVWAPLALLSKLIDERIRLGLSQAEVASRMGVARSAVVKLENDPDGVSFARILSYACALGVELVPKTSRSKPKVARLGPGRPVNAGAANARKPRLG